MSDVIVEVEAPESEPEPAVIIAESGDDDVAMDITTIALVERVTRLEDALALVTVAVEALTEQLTAMQVVDEIQQEEIQLVAEEVEEVAEESADAVEEVVEDIDEASPEIKPDELPTVREHFFFRKWGRNK
jgi:uncharacterized coiled-coil protein SlyX